MGFSSFVEVEFTSHMHTHFGGVRSTSAAGCGDVTPTARKNLEDPTTPGTGAEATKTGR